jgi:hypothetical protein
LIAPNRFVSETLYRFGLEAEVMFASHHWPRWGNARVQEVLRAQRDLYANMNNQVLHLANQGVTINEVHNIYQVPKGLQNQWHCRGYHGSFENNSRCVIRAMGRSPFVAMSRRSIVIDVDALRRSLEIRMTRPGRVCSSFQLDWLSAA